MSHHNKRQSFAPYAAIIVVAIIAVALTNTAAVYWGSSIDQERDHNIIQNQQAIIKSMSDYSLADLNQSKISTLYHGALLYLFNNQLNAVGNMSGKLDSITGKLDNLIAAHNEMIKAIENATGHHTPIINKITNIHNSYCTVNQVYVPPTSKCHQKK